MAAHPITIVRMVPGILRILPLAVLLHACGGTDSRPETKPASEIPFRVDGSLDFVRADSVLFGIAIEIAESDSARERGMMQRTSFPSESGMLFLFDDVQIRQFWMGNTPLSLDLIFIGERAAIVDFSKYATPFSDEGIVSRVPAQHVLEVPAGFVDSRGLVEGDQVRWRRTGE